jgi:hypothetical protein
MWRPVGLLLSGGEGDVSLERRGKESPTRAIQRPDASAPLRRSTRIERALERSGRVLETSEGVRVRAMPQPRTETPLLAGRLATPTALAAAASPTDVDGRVVRDDIFLSSAMSSRRAKVTDDARKSVSARTAADVPAPRAVATPEGRDGESGVERGGEVGGGAAEEKAEAEADGGTGWFDIGSLDRALVPGLAVGEYDRHAEAVPVSEQHRRRLAAVRRHVRELQERLIDEVSQLDGVLDKLLDPSWRPSEVTENHTYVGLPESINDPSRRFLSARVFVPRIRAQPVPPRNPQDL